MRNWIQSFGNTQPKSLFTTLSLRVMASDILSGLLTQDEDIAAITAEFAKMPALYIADGHHRSAAAALVGAEKAKQNANHRGDEEYNYFMAVCFPANQLTIIDYNRVVKDLNGLNSRTISCCIG